jgi:hypothetical protein
MVRIKAKILWRSPFPRHRFLPSIWGIPSFIDRAELGRASVLWRLLLARSTVVDPRKVEASL